MREQPHRSPELEGVCSSGSGFFEEKLNSVSKRTQHRKTLVNTRELKVAGACRRFS